MVDLKYYQSLISNMYGYLYIIILKYLSIRRKKNELITQKECTHNNEL